jgi:hypothetical protein
LHGFLNLVGVVVVAATVVALVSAMAVNKVPDLKLLSHFIN